MSSPQPINADAVSTRILRAHIFIWRLAGIWPQPNDWLVYRVYAVFAFVVASLVFNVTLMLNLVEHHTVDQTVATLLPATTTVMTTVKVCLHLINQRRIERMFALMRDLELRLEMSTHPQVIERTVLRSRNLLFVLSCAAYSAITMAALIAVLNGHRLMWPTWFPWDWEHSALRQLALVGFQYVTNLYIGMLYTTLNTYAPVLYMILTAYLEILGEQLRSIGQRKSAETGFSGEEMGRLRKCYEEHKMCIRLGEMLNEIFGVHYAIHFCCSGLVICTTAFQMSSVGCFITLFSRINLIFLKFRTHSPRP